MSEGLEILFVFFVFVFSVLSLIDFVMTFMAVNDEKYKGKFREANFVVRNIIKIPFPWGWILYALLKGLGVYLLCVVFSPLLVFAAVLVYSVLVCIGLWQMDRV